MKASWADFMAPVSAVFAIGFDQMDGVSRDASPLNIAHNVF